VRCSTRWSPPGPTPRCSPDLAKGKLRSKIPALREALEGRFEAHHALIIGAILAHLDFLEELIARLGDAIEAELVPYTTGQRQAGRHDHQLERLGQTVTLQEATACSHQCGPAGRSPRQSPTWSSGAAKHTASSASGNQAMASNSAAGIVSARAKGSASSWS
jgi:hypothetical protein